MKILLDLYKRYLVTITAKDAGLPPLSKDAVMRIDTFDPDKHVVIVRASLIGSELDDNQDEFLKHLGNVSVFKYFR